VDQISAEDVGYMLGHALFFGGLPALGAYVGRRLTNRREDGRTVRWPMRAALVLIALSVVGRCSSPQHPQSEAAPLIVVPAPPVVGHADITIVQTTAGRAADFPASASPDLVRSYDKGFRDRIVDKVRRINPSIPPDAVITSTHVVRIAGHTIWQSEARVASILFVRNFAGVVGEKIVVVLCIAGDAKPFDTAGTECERTVRRAFQS
jgi:hypothetical protein